VGVTVLFAGTPGERSSRRAEREQRWAERRTTPQGWTSASVVPPEEKKMETITPPAGPTKPDDGQSS
jgi:hypothetical protein